MTRQIKTTTLIFLIMLGFTLLIWVLRGFGLLGFVPGGLVWILIFASILLAVLSNIR